MLGIQAVCNATVVLLTCIMLMWSLLGKASSDMRTRARLVWFGLGLVEKFREFSRCIFRFLKWHKRLKAYFWSSQTENRYTEYRYSPQNGQMILISHTTLLYLLASSCRKSFGWNTYLCWLLILRRESRGETGSFTDITFTRITKMNDFIVIIPYLQKTF